MRVVYRDFKPSNVNDQIISKCFW